MGLFNFFNKKDKANANTKESFDHFTKVSIESANFFVTRYSDRFKGLDFSVKSLEVVDLVLDEASDFYDDMSEEQRQNLVNTAGSYIFEVARCNFGGKYFWYNQLNQPILVTGQPDFEVSILAIEKVKGRLENGSEDNIPFYFAGYIERVQSKQSAMIV